ncbi:protocatechuate 3,4-dioxygenase subunit alpha [uncultured Ferrovibrio sp.]|jgi:protocatechuate 3,4-dioxygenase alpha subunit|uniref:protocatechuate 3,4-dioxygenase subunit alpha n=1 Tax=uncultured Ferrovibrio sp. TaxID=1576913 RepID=UPI00261ADF89|nr:protocatechuate 3,4-dioxygenase subunit alpha [uncultured Ferrovibrio sp.]
MSLIPTASQTVGPYLHLGLTPITIADIAKDAGKGEKIVISGRVLDGEGQPIPDALLEFWQANADGKYAHPDDTQDKPLEGKFIGFGRVPTDKDGRFSFTTIKPGAVPGPGNSLQAPHIVVCLFMRGMLKHLYTRIYFSDEQAANANDPVLGLIEDAARRPTLIAERQNDKAEYRWDIVMQGENETVFFDC